MKYDDEAMLAAQIEKFLQELTASEAEKPTLVVIGGFAARAHGAQRLSHDGDIMVDNPTYGALRDRFNISRNQRLGKAQFSTPFGADIDVYVEKTHKLRVPFDELQAYAEKRRGLWVACAEHLLILKLAALKERRNSDKGEKDTEDILVLISQTPLERTDILKKHMFPADWELLEDVVSTPGNWQSFAKNNYRKAAILQEGAEATLRSLKKSVMDIE
jgi:hypothetical protein